MSGERSRPRGPLTGRVLFADGTDERFDDLAAIVDEADGRLTRELESDLFAIVTDTVDDPELVNHALENGSAVLTPENAIGQITAQLARWRTATDAHAASSSTDEEADDAAHSAADVEIEPDKPQIPLYRRIDWEKLAAIAAIGIIVVFAVNVWNERSEERSRYEAEVRVSATETRTTARCTTLASGEQGEVLVFNELLADSTDRDGEFWSDVVDELVVLCEQS